MKRRGIKSDESRKMNKAKRRPIERKNSREKLKIQKGQRASCKVKWKARSSKIENRHSIGINQKMPVDTGIHDGYILDRHRQKRSHFCFLFLFLCRLFAIRIVRSDVPPR